MSNGPTVPGRASTLPASTSDAGPSTLPTSAVATSIDQSDPFAAGPSRPAPIVKPIEPLMARAHPVNPQRAVRMSAATKTRRKENLEARLKRNIELANARLERMKQDQAAEKAANEGGRGESGQDRIAGQRRQFDEHVLE